MNELTKWAEEWQTVRSSGYPTSDTDMLLRTVDKLAKAILADNKHWTEVDEERAMRAVPSEPVEPRLVNPTGEQLTAQAMRDIVNIPMWQQSRDTIRNELLDELIEWADEQHDYWATHENDEHSAGAILAYWNAGTYFAGLKDRDGAVDEATAETGEETHPSPQVTKLMAAGTGTSYYANGEDFITALDELSDSPPPVRIELTAEWVDGQGVTYSASNKDTLPEGGYAASHTSLNELSKTVAEGMKLMFDTDDDVPVEWVFGEGFEVSQDGRVGVVNLVEPPPTAREIAEQMWDEWGTQPTKEIVDTRWALGLCHIHNGQEKRGGGVSVLAAIITRAFEIRDGE